MRKPFLFAAMMLSVSMLAVPVLAEEATEEAATQEAPVTAEAEEVLDDTTEAEDIDETAEEATDRNLPEMSPVFGAWYGAGYIGNYQYRLNGHAYVLPDNTLSYGDTAMAFEMTGEDSFSSDLADTITVTGQVGILTEEDIELFDVDTDFENLYDATPGAPKLVVTLSYPDTKNPLASEPETTDTIFLFSPSQSEFLKMSMTGKAWQIGANTLVIDSERKLDLNDGATTGSASFNNNDNYPMLVTFNWDGSGVISYVPTSITAEKITLTNIDNPDEVLELEFIENIVAEEEPATEEEAVTEEAAEEEPAA